jgi:hypothetical protein
MPYDIKVEIYDKSVNDPTKAKLFESTGQKQFVYEPQQTNLDKIYILYVIPPGKNTDPNIVEKGCVVLVTGFQNV